MKIIRSCSNLQEIFPEYFTSNPRQEIALSKYAMFQKVSVDKYVLFSFATDAILFLSRKEYEAILKMHFYGEDILFETLHKNGFFINKNIDECSLMDRQRRAIFSAVSNTLKVVILPTTGCNARCSYCIGMGNPIASMTQDNLLLYEGVSIIKLNGDFDVPNQVLTEQDYLRYEANFKNLYLNFQSDLYTHSFLIIGSSLSDGLFLPSLFKLFQETKPKHTSYCFNGLR